MEHDRFTFHLPIQYLLFHEINYHMGMHHDCHRREESDFYMFYIDK